MKRIFSLVLFLVGIITAQAQEYDFSKIRSIINDRIDNHQVPSISIAVVKGNKIVWEESFGFADKERKIKATVNTPYYVASVTKTITATALMKLAEEKKINLDSPVNTYLSAAKMSSDLWDVH